MLQGSGFLIFNYFRQKKVKFGLSAVSLLKDIWARDDQGLLCRQMYKRISCNSHPLTPSFPPHLPCRYSPAPAVPPPGHRWRYRCNKGWKIALLSSFRKSKIINICLCNWSWLTLVTMQLQIEWNKWKWSWVTSIMSSSWRRWYCMILYAPWYCIALHDIA